MNTEELAHLLLLNLESFPSVTPVSPGGIVMREASITLPELALVGGTRALLGAGVGLLLADRFPQAQRRAIGWTLLLVGALTTVPLALEILGKTRSSASTGWSELGPDGPRRTENDRLGQRVAAGQT
jgi:hypothetical protein